MKGYVSLKLLRKEFIEYYVELGYSLREASNLVLKDNSLFFTNSGMIQFKDLYMSDEPVREKYLTIQPCVRLSGKQNDLEEIGKSPYHHTSFEMLGLFQFSDVTVSSVIESSVSFLTKYIRRENLTFHVHPRDEEGISALNSLRIGAVIYDESCVWSTSEERCSEGYSIEIYYVENDYNVEI